MRYASGCFLAFLLNLSMGWTANFTAPQGDPVAVAQAGYQAFIAGPLHNAPFCEEHGITEADVSGKITLGTPYRLYSMTPSHVRDYTPGTPVCLLSEKTGIYMFPVCFNGQAKLFLNVCHFGTDTFEIGSLGESWLCHQLNAIQAIHHRTEGAPLQLIQNYQTGCYLFHDPQLGTDNLTFIPSDNAPILGPRKLSTAADSMTRMKTLLQTKLGLE